MLQQKSTIGQLAKEAKKRMKNCYNCLNSATMDIRDSKKILTFEKSSLMVTGETNCYKIYEVLQSGNFINSLECLIDKEHLSRLSPAERQRYIFKLSEAYINIKRQLVGEEAYR